MTGSSFVQRMKGKQVISKKSRSRTSEQQWNKKSQKSTNSSRCLSVILSTMISDTQYIERQANNNHAINTCDNSEDSPENSSSHVSLPPPASSQTESDFSIIWQNLTYKVNTRSWLSGLSDKCKRGDELSNDIETNGLYNNVDDYVDNDYMSRPQTDRVVLNEVCGSVKSRQLTGILGPSGAGKSSLLHCLFRNRTEGTTGKIFVENCNKRTLKVCFIPQTDYLNQYLTVREDLRFVSRLRLVRVDERVRGKDSTLHDRSDRIKDTENRLLKNETVVKCDASGYAYGTSLFDHESNVLRAAELLGISNCLDVLIRDISGGQRKRLSIARELMSQPDVLILDEPTTGLDSAICLKTMLLLRDLAHSSPYPMAVICTIHQPPRSVFELFDRTYFLSNRGLAVYENHPRKLIRTLENVIGVKSSVDTNCANVLIEICTNPTKYCLVENLVNYQRAQFYRTYSNDYLLKLAQNKSPNEQSNCTNNNLSDQNLNNSSIGNDSASISQQTYSPSRWCGCISQNNDPQSVEYYISPQLSYSLTGQRHNWWQSVRHTFILAHRFWLELYRNSGLTRSRFAFHIGLPLITLLVFGTTSGSPNGCPAVSRQFDLSNMRTSLNDQTVRRNVEATKLTLENLSFFFILTYGFAINIVSTTASRYPQTVHLFRKEITNGLYSPAAYYMGQLIAELPQEIFYPSMSIFLGYTLSGQASSYMQWRMFAVAMYFFLGCYCVHAIGLMSGAIFPGHTTLAVMVGQVALFPAVVFSGFIFDLDYMIPYLRKFASTSIFRHTMRGIVAARYGLNVCQCDEDDIPDGGKLGGIPNNIKHVLEYIFPKNATEEIQASEVFDKLAYRFSQAQTFAYNITSCADVVPYVMNQFKVKDADLYENAIWYLQLILVLKLLTFLIFRRLPYREQ